MGPVGYKKLVLFGAGKIGRSFIGQLFSAGGYEVVFIDINKAVIDELNRKGSYKVIMRSDKGDEILNISNVRGVDGEDKNQVIHEIATAAILAISVGANGLKDVLPLVAGGLLQRFTYDSSSALDIIIAENMRNADLFVYNHLKTLLPDHYPIDSHVGLIETSIGKMVPLIHRKDSEEDILRIFAEPFNTLILNRKGFRNPIPAIKGLAPKDNMKAWVDRKLFIHNLGHSSAAYIGFIYDHKLTFIHEALSVSEIFSYVRAIMKQSSEILLVKYPGEFTGNDLDDHIDDLLSRFQNKALGDTIFRVGCDLVRKLGPEERLAGTIKSAIAAGLRYDRILTALVCACHFRAPDEEGKMLKEDEAFVGSYHKGVDKVLESVCGFDRNADRQVFIEAEKIENILKVYGSGFLRYLQ